MLQIIDHTYKPWVKRKKNENGAGTYSRDIMASQRKRWEKLFSLKKYHDKFVFLSTCVPGKDISPRYIKNTRINLAVQYLHTYPYENPIDYITDVYQGLPKKHPTDFEMHFLSAYQSYVHIINRMAEGRNLPIRAHFVPMAVDTSQIELVYLQRREMEKYEKRIVWFGNIYREKRRLFDAVQKACHRSGYNFDYISRQRFNGKGQMLSQCETWQLLSRYRYGIGVGRCALEMYALGLRVLIAGAQFGGLLMNEADYQVQTATNFNGRIITFDRDLSTCLSVLPHSLLPSIPSITDLNHAEIVRKHLT